MPVYKYKTFELAEQDLWTLEPGKLYYQRLHEIWEFADSFSSKKFPPGVFKFKSISEANQQQQRIENS